MLNIANHIYFVGIGGIGMSGLARILLGFGSKVSGSDVVESAMVKSLKAAGAEIFIGHRGEQLAADVDMVVYSSVIKEDNPEYIAAKNRGIQIISRAELLAKIMAQRTSIAVAGAHGKTSTTGMMGTVFLHCQQKPTIIVGGVLPAIQSNSCWGSGEYLIAEADESDGSFLILPPKIVVVTNVENDHLDYYGSMENLIKCFKQFIHQIPEDGLAILGIDSKIVAEIAASKQRSYITYGIKNQAADYQAKSIQYTGFGTVSQIYFKGEFIGELRLNVPGLYNISNALATIALSHTLGLPMAGVLAGLAEFTGTGRRFELLGMNKAKDIVVFDDYAHHPTEIMAVLNGAKRLPFKRVIAVFQPHRYSRTQMLQAEFIAAFDEADVVVLNEIYSAFEKPIEGVNSTILVEGIRKRGNNPVYYGQTEADVLARLDEIVESGDLVLIMGAGNIRHTGEVYAKALKEK